MHRCHSQKNTEPARKCATKFDGKRPAVRRKRALDSDALHQLEVTMLRILEFASAHPTMEWHQIRGGDPAHVLALETLADRGVVQIE